MIRRRGSELVTSFFVSLLLLLISFAIGVTPALRIARDHDSTVVLSPIGRETLIIDTASSYHVERIDAPIERIEIRLIDDNSSSPLLIDIQKIEESGSRLPESERIEDAFPVVEPSEEASREHNPSTPSPPPPPPQQQQHEEFPAEDDQQQPQQQQQQHNDDAVVTNEQTDDELIVEECLDNEKLLETSVIVELKRKRRKLLQHIRVLNKQMNTYCRFDRDDSLSIEYRKCPVWREEKMVFYYKLMRIIYCSDYTKWPNAQKIKRSYGRLFPLFERLYAFVE